jgi:peptidoglycan/LPS O-acetylase OafA/YrhL
MAKTRRLEPEPVEPPDPILSEPALRRCIIGAQRGLKVVAVFFGVTLVGFAITLGHLFDGRTFGVVDVAFMYFGWGLVGGALGGLAIPIARGPMSSIPVAALIFLPLAIAVRVMNDGWTSWHLGDVLFLLAASLFMALIWGPLAWKRLHENDRAQRDR